MVNSPRRGFSLTHLWVLFSAVSCFDSSPARATAFNVWSLPVTPDVYEQVTVGDVRADVLTPYPTWKKEVEVKNVELAGDVQGWRIGVIEVKLEETEDPLDSMGPFIEEARKGAARLGANMVTAETHLMDMSGSRYVSLTFNAYRVQYKGYLIPPQYLAALPAIALSDSLLQEELRTWDSQHFGITKVSFNKEGPHPDIAGFFDGIQKGAPIRLIFKDGSDYKGAFAGTDADGLVWVHPAGFKGFFSDRSFRPEEIIIVALLK